MLRMLRRVRRQRTNEVDGEVDNDDRRSSAQRVAPWGLPARSRLQWWQGAISGAIAVVSLVGAAMLLAGHPSVPRTPIDEPNQKDKENCPVYNAVTGETTVPSEDAPRKRKVLIFPNNKYPIESKAWSDRVLKAKEARSKGPKGATPDQIGRAALSRRFEQGWGEGKPSPQQQQPRERGSRTGAVLTLLENDVVDDVKRFERFLAVLGGVDLYPADGAGVGPAPDEGAGGNTGQAWEDIILCEDLAKEFERSLEGAQEEAWRRALDLGIVKLVSCKGPTGDRLSGELSLACVAAHGASSEWLWVPSAAAAAAVAGWGPEAGAKVVEQLSSLAKTSTVEGVFGMKGWVRNKRPPPPPRRPGGRPQRVLAIYQPTEQPLQSSINLGTDDWTAIDSDDFPLPQPGAPIEQPIPLPELASSHFRDGEAEQPLQPGTNLGIDHWASIDSDDFPLPQPRASVAQQRRHLSNVSQLRGGAVQAAWEFIGGVVDQKAKEGTSDDAAVVEVDALTDAVFVRADHLRHACSFISATATAANAAESKQPLRRGLGAEEGDSPGSPNPENRVSGGMVDSTATPIETGLMKLSAVSYVVRKTLGVRSFAKSGLLSWAGGKSWDGQGGPGGVDIATTLGDGEVSVPGSEFLPWECLSPSVAEAVLLSVTSVEDLRSLKPLLREFLKSEAYDPYLVLSSSSVAVGSPDLKRELETVSAAEVEADEGELGGDATVTKFGVCGTIDLERATSGATGGRGAQMLEERWVTLLSRLSPVAVIAVHDRAREGFAENREAWGGGAGGDTEGERAARRACARAEAQTAFIAMPSEEARHALWLPRLAPVALASWSRPRFSVSVITNDRPESLARLLASLKRSRLFGDELAVDFYVESSADDETLGIVEAFSSEWEDRGPVQTHFRVLKGGLIRAVTESFYPSNRHHHAFLLEDDVEISPHFYAWSKWVTLTYQYGESSDFLRDMYGVSLYTPRVDELSKKRQVYDSNELIAAKTGGVRYSPFLYQIPCSWGAVFFPETWMEYRLYLAARLREDHIRVNIEGSKTNLWNTSWKRFFIEMAYQAQYYMLYPNFFNQTSFSTNWLELGEHIKVDKPEGKDDVKGGDKEDSPRSPPSQTKGDKKHLPKDYTVPLMDGSASLIDPLPGKRLLPLGSLPRMDILNRDVRPGAKHRT